MDAAASGRPTNGPALAAGIPEEGDPEKLWKQMEAAGL
jgi:hypothetical protein